MAQVVWKDIIWTDEGKERGIKELLTILKGYGPMEVLDFEKPGRYKGQLSLWLDEQGIKHVTLFHLEVIGEKRKGAGRKALKHLQKIFGGDLYVQDPGEATPPEGLAGGIHVRQPNQESAMFWIRMFKENLIQSVEGDLMSLDEETSPDEIETLEREFSAALKNTQETPSAPLRSSSS
jgi:hypothetical protein